ncbi:MAG: bifunctional pyr operon transcriptional regulator/uracil phosphoribosyltransferase PyrR [Proteobacteria bacterium]|nr:bifunctional pyr operon transcriptional regulator/uracil phosphoribosyltransferase PyrR [Pseudomonadota bacterium]
MNKRFDQTLLNGVLADFTDRCRDLTQPDDIVVGIRQGGVLLADFLCHQLGHKHPPGQLDINFHRDDFGHRQPRKVTAASEHLTGLDGGRIILIDDVLWTGRTVRAALNELFDFGRPRQIILAVLFDRGGRELPVEATVTGHTLALANSEQIKLGKENDSLYAEISNFATATNTPAR